MDLTKIINSGATNITFSVSSKDLKTFAVDFAEELAATTKTPQKKEKFLTTREVCELLSISRITLWQWDKKGITRPNRVGNLKRYRASDIEKMMSTEV